MQILFVSASFNLVSNLSYTVDSVCRVENVSCSNELNLGTTFAGITQSLDSAENNVAICIISIKTLNSSVTNASNK